ncbi:MAG: pectinesterase family protein [Spirosomataceae bacterium]
MKHSNQIFLLITLTFLSFRGFSQKIIVSKDGKGDFRSIQEAINSLDTTTQTKRLIYIKNGVYAEKLMITKSFFRLKGESEKGVIIKISLPRDVWRCQNPDDFGAATINVKGHDIVFENLSVINNYGFEVKGDSMIICQNESGNQNNVTRDRYTLPREKGEAEGTKIVRKDGHQFAFRSMPGATRLSFINCTFRAGGGDTVSPWDVEGGLFYFKNCIMEGHVDFYCPRGWAYAENCKFICHNMNAAIWHDGSGNKDQKTVLKNCTFEGDKGYKLGRFHREAQFYLIDCKFDENMADADIYWVTAAPKPIEWGRRVYYFNCHRPTEDFDWHKDNIEKNLAKSITPSWVFGDKWKSLKP